ncbi:MULTISPECIES: [NiFe]-hydrogenase assembly chaperone HybE [Sinorhizobium]|uniref:[NiFe]-hydrogenase assembly chaperone HybE n=1 Tax=Sinorhizobium TaxID=28105 RepID=UPI0024B12067|nr:[NiFe]-hydrogenase assembly chaperone HybE [Sinorhizobium terangae]WFU51964.1 [NiFe]-hydrogenase assembly chaperone HybE [Sinorhizobium terangae]
MITDLTMRGELDAALAVGERVVACHRHIHDAAMTDVPICNHELRVAATGFRTYRCRAFGVVATAWFVSVAGVDLPEGAPAATAAIGTTLRIGLPAGEVEFITRALHTFGRVDSSAPFAT